ncbi:hypothetical protein ACJ73_06804 [Blastomyces percursus]|uniref:Uncharacterized protein n=1 Tax=Blastomyces percursus TaxID=1658174 RepID=A0A1J9PZW4_9EURO|nr:hypothetical protein ACJ73_06804 [Blastomyces percursus]
MTPSLPEHAAASEIRASFYDPQRSPRSSPPTMDQLLSRFVRPRLPRSADGEPGSSPDNPIDLDDRTDEKRDTEPLSEDREASHLGGDTERECDSETGDGRNSEATSIRDLKGESQTQPQSGPRPTGPPQPVPEPEPKAVTACERCLDCVGSDEENVEPLPPPSPRSISGALPDIISEDGPSKETHAKVGDSFAPHLEPDTSGSHILLHREAREGHFEFLLWRPYGSGRMTLRRSIRISSSVTRRGWTSGLQKGRESEHGPLFQSLGDHHVRKSRGSAKYRFGRMRVNGLLLLQCCLVLYACLACISG